MSIGNVLVVLVLALGLLSTSCSGNAENGPTAETNTGSFKSATVDDLRMGSGVTTLLTLPFSAPAEGFVSVSATGTCTVLKALPVGSFVAVQIETAPDDSTPHPGDGSFLAGGENGQPSQGSFAVMRVLPVSAGENVVYLVIDNPSTGGVLGCSASLLVVFQGQQLP